MVPRQGNAMAEMSASLVASSWSLTILCNGDATTIPRSFLFVWVSLLRTTAEFNFSHNPWEEQPQRPFAPVNPKQPGAALLFAWKLCQTVVKPAFHSLHFDTKDNYGQHGQRKLVLYPKFTSRWRFQSMLFFYANYNIVSVAVSASRQWQMLLLAWRERDESLTWWWQDNRRSANGNLLFLGKASFSCSQKCLQTVYFLLPPSTTPLCWRSINPLWFTFYHTRSTDFKEKI